MGEAVVVTTREAMVRQAHEALAELEAKGAESGTTLRDMADIDRAAFSRLIEALVALGQPVSRELRDLAGLRPVSEVLGLP